jgi:hypothetical protein
MQQRETSQGASTRNEVWNGPALFAISRRVPAGSPLVQKLLECSLIICLRTIACLSWSTYIRIYQL